MERNGEVILMSTKAESVAKWKVVRQMRGSLCLDDARSEQVAWMLKDGRSPDQIRSFLKMDDGEYDAVTAGDLFKFRLAYLTEKSKRKTKMPKTPDECLQFAKLGLVKLSKTAETDKTKVDALKALASVAIDERKNGTQVSGTPAISEAMAKLMQAP